MIYDPRSHYLDIQGPYCLMTKVNVWWGERVVFLTALGGVVRGSLENEQSWFVEIAGRSNDRAQGREAITVDHKDGLNWAVGILACIYE